MRVVRTVQELRAACEAARAGGQTVGFVPTMGALHAGHLALVDRARSECGWTVVSIFVNPTQFGPHEDLASYPRPIEDDLRACEDAGVDLVFHPDPAEMYPRPPATSVHVSGLTDRMEGAVRPGHFDGVCLVVTKLLNAVGACRAYFGRKDAQQLAVVARMVADLDMPVEIVPCETVREPDGLALSSRNAYLSPEDRRRAPVLYEALSEVRERIEAGEREAARAIEAGLKVLHGEEVDYLDVVDPDTFEPVELVERAVVVCGAVRLGGTRLIDNVTAIGGKGRR
ncbi:MAG TPA: pantoate--beta-alanine ligase [Actinomycetota bacterium]|nr:pantoate--beta-alanine ligase [Actinomycetota bacterium]